MFEQYWDSLKVFLWNAVWAVNIAALSPVHASVVRTLRVGHMMVRELADGQLNVRAASLVPSGRGIQVFSVSTTSNGKSLTRCASPCFIVVSGRTSSHRRHFGLEPVYPSSPQGEGQGEEISSLTPRECLARRNSCG